MTLTLPKGLTALHLAQFQNAYLTPADTVATARQWLQKYTAWRHIPIVENQKFVGLLPKKALAHKSPEMPLGKLPILTEARIYIHATVYDILHKIHQNRLRAVGVVDEEGNYHGIITPYELVNWWANLAAVKEPGSVLLLECAIHDYSLARIAHIVESEGLKILSAYILDHNSDLSRLYIVLRLNSSYMGALKELLQRQGYTVLVSYENPEEEKLLRQRLDALLRYIKT